MTRATVLGGGLVGAVVAADLAADGWEITVVDRAEAALERVRALAGPDVALRRADLTDPTAIAAEVAAADLVLGALPGHLGYRALRAVIEAGRSCCDISFMPEDPRDLDDLARERGVTVVYDCGVAPGLSNMLCGHAVAMFDDCERVVIQVGGLPVKPVLPFEYKAGFSPSDVIEEYVRPARYVEAGVLTEVPALSGLVHVDLPGVPTLESFLTDGLRSLLDTLAVPFQEERTLRYPGHARLMAAFREAGLFSSEPLPGGPPGMRPVDLTLAGLLPCWTYAPGEADLTVMRVEASGRMGGVQAHLVWDLLDYADLTRGFSSMARTTAFPCTLVAREIAAGRVRTHGVLPPERLATDAALLERILEGLAARGVVLQTSSNAAG
ncbi:MAG: saccharopine dehydrogenase NADP-binding domain-containing protein [Planctomycetota bacterium]|nr:saccharopine dehydrogenase NADP-binding domain-containing protein [Planctomycetota bacterium]